MCASNIWKSLKLSSREQLHRTVMDGHSQTQTANFPTEQALCVCVYEPHFPGTGGWGGGGIVGVGGKLSPADARLEVSHCFSCCGWTYFSALGISDLGEFYLNTKSIKCSIWEPVL